MKNDIEQLKDDNKLIKNDNKSLNKKIKDVNCSLSNRIMENKKKIALLEFEIKIIGL